jgi:hypothetical protein
LPHSSRTAKSAVLLPEDLGQDEFAEQWEKFMQAYSESRSVYALNARRINAIFYLQLQNELSRIDTSLPGRITAMSSFTDLEDPEDGFSLPERIAEGLYPAGTP